MGGYASSLFANFWTFSPSLRQEFGREEASAFVARYGYRKLLTSYETAPSDRRGAVTDRELGRTTVVGEAPGIHPTFITNHQLRSAVIVLKSDLDVELPPLAEEPVPLEATDPVDSELLAEYKRLQDKLLACIKADRFDKQRAGRLLGTLVELPSYLDRATDDLEPFVLAYPEELGSEVIATGRAFPAGWRTPKERFLLDRIAALLGRGERVLVFVRHTGSLLPNRLLRLVRTLTPRAAFLHARKVPAGSRGAWIDEHVLATGCEVLIVNPNAIRTGLNNLIAFTAAVWHELDLSATTYRQANGRLHRIGQTRPVTIHVPYLAGTAQQTLFDLVARKLSTSLLVDGLDLQAALEAAGAGDDETQATAAAMSMGQAIYASLTGRRAL
jgi:hypothetical protein